MKGPDLDRQRSEERHTLMSFLKMYNSSLPLGFPRASAPLLQKFKKLHPAQFVIDGLWSLDTHRKKFMDWLPSHLKALEA